MTARKLDAQRLQKDWTENPRWKGIKRSYSADDVVRLRGSVAVEHTLARRGAEQLWTALQNEPFVNALGALTGNQAMQQVKAGLQGDLSVGLAGGGRRQRCRRPCIRTSRCIRSIRCPRSSSASTTR